MLQDRLKFTSTVAERGSDVPRRLLLRALAALPLLGLVKAARSRPGSESDLDLMQRLAAERYGSATEEMVIAWRHLMKDITTQDVPEQLASVNTFFNRRIRFEDDIDIWGIDDYWATPLETMGKGAGDCEDFTIAKYMTLRLLGVPNEQLRLIYVRAQVGGAGSPISLAHMVLGFYPTPTDEPLILDNLIGEVRPAARRPDLFPVFSFNSEGLWVGGASTSSADPTARLSRWRNVLERMRREGLQ